MPSENYPGKVVHAEDFKSIAWPDSLHKAFLATQPPVPYVICDLDGTLCDVRLRAHHARLREWDWFHAGIPNDPPNPAVLMLVRMCKVMGVPVVFMTGRPERYRPETVTWLTGVFLWDHNTQLFMREEKDFSQDTVVKERMYTWYQHANPNHVVAFVLEDRNAVVAMWRSLGLTCFQVQDGSY